MSAVDNKYIKWQHVAGIGMICVLAVAGCSRSDKVDTTEAVEANEQATTENSAVTPAVDCDNQLVQDRLKTALKNMLNQQAQTIASTYANEAEVSLDGSAVSSKINGIVIDVQNAGVLQEANANGMTTCQASISMTLPSEDLYQASQISAANNAPSLETRLAQDNIRVNNSMLIDEAFTYVTGAQWGQVQVRIAGQPAIITIVADIMASSALKATIDSQAAQAPAQVPPRRREPVQNNSQNQPIRQPKPAAPAKPAQPAKPVQPAKPASPSTSNANKPSNPAPSAPKTPPQPEVTAPVTPKASVPKDDSIDMVIIEDDSATY